MQNVRQRTVPKRTYVFTPQAYELRSFSYDLSRYHGHFERSKAGIGTGRVPGPETRRIAKWNPKPGFQKSKPGPEKFLDLEPSPEPGFPGLVEKPGATRKIFGLFLQSIIRYVAYSEGWKMLTYERIELQVKGSLML